MANRYWVGTDTNWHLAANWSLTSGGAGGAGIPTASDDVFFDGNGNVVCFPTSDIVCNNMSLLVTMTEMLLISANAVIHGDFSMAAGYFGPTGGPDHTIEFKGNWLNTGGSFSVGTGTGKDPECIFSGKTKTYQLNQLSGASFQHLTISGEYVFTGTRLGVANVTQTLNVSGILDIQANGAIICDVDVSGNAATVEVTGEITGTGRLWYRYKSNSVIGTGGVISVRYMRYVLQDATAEIDAREYVDPCEVEIEYLSSNQVCSLKAGNHKFYKLLLIENNAAITAATFDCDTYTAQMWCESTFKIDINDFPAAVVTIKFGDGVHVFKHSVEFFFSYASGSGAQLVVDPGEGTLILWSYRPSGLGLLTIPSYRLSRIHSAGMDYITYNKVILFSEEYSSVLNPRFVEGFKARELLVESYLTSWQFRRYAAIPNMMFEFDNMTVIGSEVSLPQLLPTRSLTPPYEWGLQVNQEAEVFSCKLRNVDASYGIGINAYNSTAVATTNNINFYDRDVRSIGGQRNLLSSRTKISPTPAPERITEQLLEVW